MNGKEIMDGVESKTSFVCFRTVLATCSHSGFLHRVFFDLILEAIYSSEMSLDFQRLHGIVSQKANALHKVNSFTSKTLTGKTSSTTVGLKLHHQHTFSYVINKS